MTLRTEPGGESTDSCTDRISAVVLSGRFSRGPRVLTQELSQAIRDSVAVRVPLAFLMPWGKGRKRSTDHAETLAVEFLARLQVRLREVYPPGFNLTVMLTDTHAAINGYTREETTRYFDAVREALRPLAPGYAFTSELWSRTGITYEAIDAHARAISDSEWERVEQQMHLVDRARRAVARGDAESCAKRYLVARRLENALLEQLYPSSIYVTSDSIQMSPLLPRIATLHLYSRRRGWCEKPWNVTLRKEAC